CQRTTPEYDQWWRPHRGRHPATPEEEQKRQQECRTDQAAELAMRPFPPVDRLERLEAHAAIHRAVLRRRLVFLELGPPGVLRQRRRHPGDRLPFGDRK